MLKGLGLVSLSVLLFISCKTKNSTYKEPQNSLFRLMPNSETGIFFNNKIVDDSIMNIFNYRNFYNGGGVAIGDINNDGLPDVFFTANQEKNKLFLNKGNFKFEDITEAAGLNIPKFWSTGVTMVDINADGFLDIYVCNAGDAKGKQRTNQLFINNKNNTFEEKAIAFNLQDAGGYHTQAAFFDYDMDGDLDCYLLNNSSFPVAQVKNWDQREKRDTTGGDKLLQNNNNVFTDVSEKAGIYGSLIGFGLGVNVGDVNGDLWPDIYVSNDFFEKDYLYINQKNGTFKEDIENQMQHTSQSSMGADMADINNDGLVDIFTTDMLPEDDYRLKTMTKFDDYDFFNTKLKGNLHKQFLQNCLQLNNGNNSFSEIAQLSGVNATDWSWGALIFDFDNDGNKDIYVSNGIYRDLTNQDYIDFLADENIKAEVAANGHFDVQKFLKAMKSTPLPNYGFLNNGNLQFANKSYDLGLAKPSFSNGAAYADLDNDGDQDLVVNNVNMECFVYKNNTEIINKNNFLKVSLQGDSQNSFGIGASLTVYTKEQKFLQQQQPTRGFQSSMDLVLNFGLGKIDKIDSLEVIWPNLKRQVFINPIINTSIIAKQTDAINYNIKIGNIKPLFVNATQELVSGDIAHKEDAYIDFDKERLMPKMLSIEGPKIVVADFNKDGIEDFCIGGAAGDETKMFIQNEFGKFLPSVQNAFMQDKDFEDVGLEANDVDKDGDMDLLIVSGGNASIFGSTNYAPRLYLNDDKGGFLRANEKLPFISINASCVKFNDYDNDGYDDIFIGARNTVGIYGLIASSYLLKNDGQGNFTDVTKTVAPILQNIGMVTDAKWADINGDNNNELILAGDWMPITILNYRNEQLTLLSTIENTNGWWNEIKIEDFNNDGMLDILGCNWGLNSKLKADLTHPAKLYVNDFDNNGQYECLATYFKTDGIAYPYYLKGDITAQMPSLKKKFLRYENYATKTINDIFSNNILLKYKPLEVSNTLTCIFINKGSNNFIINPLPIEAQIGNSFSSLYYDINKDGIKDIFLTGNFTGLKPELGRMDANYGNAFIGNANSNFSYLSNIQTGLFIKGEVRDSKIIRTKAGKSYLLFALNNEPFQIFKENINFN